VIGNEPKIHQSLFAPGYSIAAVIANNFAEASDALEKGALIELGLVLFGLTIIINGLARVLVLSTTRKGTK
jgi:phosphate transport system permease protein